MTRLDRTGPAIVRSLPAHLAGGALAGLTLLYAGQVLAQGAAAAADALFQQGRDEMAQGHLDSACAKLRQSDVLDPAPGTKLNLADCESKRGKLATAWELFKAAEEKLDRTDPRWKIANDRRSAIEPQVPKLVLALIPGAPAATTVHDGAAVFGPSAFGVELPLDPGNHQLQVTAPGHVDGSVTVSLEAGKVTRAQVAPGSAIPNAPNAAHRPTTTTPAPMPEAPTYDQNRNRGQKTFGFVIGGIGVAGLVVGGVAGVLTLKEKQTNRDHCNATLQTCDAIGRDAAQSGRTYGAVTTAGLAVGVVGVGLGTYFLIRSHKNDGSHTALMTQAGPGSAQLSLVQAW